MELEEETEAEVPLLSRGKPYNGQDIEPGVWEDVGPAETAKVEGNYVLWAFEDVSSGPFRGAIWEVETREGKLLGEGSVASSLLNSSTLLSVSKLNGALWEAIERAQEAAEEFMKNLQKE